MGLSPSWVGIGAEKYWNYTEYILYYEEMKSRSERQQETLPDSWKLSSTSGLALVRKQQQERQEEAWGRAQHHSAGHTAKQTCSEKGKPHGTLSSHFRNLEERGKISAKQAEASNKKNRKQWIWKGKNTNRERSTKQLFCAKSNGMIELLAKHTFGKLTLYPRAPSKKTSPERASDCRLHCWVLLNHLTKN